MSTRIVDLYPLYARNHVFCYSLRCFFVKLVKGAELTTVGTSAQTPSDPTQKQEPPGASLLARALLFFFSLIIPATVLLFTLWTRLDVDSFQMTLNRKTRSRSTPDPLSL